MKKLAIALALTGSCVLSATVASSPAFAVETYEAKMEASDAASQARVDMIDAFGDKVLKPGQYVWRDVPGASGPQRIVVSLTDQMAYLYSGSALVAATTISTGRFDKPTPDGIFPIIRKTTFYRSKKYDNAPMPFAQFFDPAGLALHAGYVGDIPNSHGCIHLPAAFAKKLFAVTQVGTPIYIGA
jgi:lipoprotein-anchoring transpeptidase ErfK/SrfK